jgi:ubiquinone/menaquinone biosynthesis C-methylase UbiE
MTSFRPGDVDYERQAASYAQARALSPSAEASWRAAIQHWLSPLNPSLVLDFGSGSGRFAPLLAEWLNCRVAGVEPSDGMRASAMHDSAHARVEYVAGDAESIPLGGASCDAAWVGYMIHHVPDRVQCAHELVRVLKPGGLVLVAGAYTEKRREISLYRYFPAGLRIVEAFPLSKDISADFARGGLEHVTDDSVRHESSPSLAAAAKRTALRADSTLQLITDEEFAAGQRAIEEAAARETDPRPIVDSIDLLVYRRP